MEDLIGDLTAVPQPIEIKLSSTTRRHRQRGGRDRAARPGGRARARSSGASPAWWTSSTASCRPGTRSSSAWTASGRPSRASTRTPWRPPSKPRGGHRRHERGRRAARGGRARMDAGATCARGRATSNGSCCAPPTATGLRSGAWRASSGWWGSPSSLATTCCPSWPSPAASPGATWARPCATCGRRWPARRAAPPASTYSLGGLYAQQQEAFRGLMAVFAAALGLVFFVLLVLYERVAVALAVLLTTGLAFAAVLCGPVADGDRAQHRLDDGARR